MAIELSIHFKLLEPEFVTFTLCYDLFLLPLIKYASSVYHEGVCMTVSWLTAKLLSGEEKAKMSSSMTLCMDFPVKTNKTINHYLYQITLDSDHENWERKQLTTEMNGRVTT